MKIGRGFVHSAGRGCHIAHYNADWIVGYSVLNKEEMDLPQESDIPEISVDPGKALSWDKCQ